MRRSNRLQMALGLSFGILAIAAFIGGRSIEQRSNSDLLSSSIAKSIRDSSAQRDKEVSDPDSNAAENESQSSRTIATTIRNSADGPKEGYTLANLPPGVKLKSKMETREEIDKEVAAIMAKMEVEHPSQTPGLLPKGFGVTQNQLTAPLIVESAMPKTPEGRADFERQLTFGIKELNEPKDPNIYAKGLESTIAPDVAAQNLNSGN